MHTSTPPRSESELEESLRTTWNARVVDYDVERFPFADRILAAIRDHGYAVETLASLHEVVPREDVYALSKLLCEDTNKPAFRRMVDDFALDEIASKGDLIPPIAAQRFLNVRIMLPDKPQGVFPFHTGLLYGHGRGSRSLWLPLTDQTREEDRSASLQIIELGRSRELIRNAMENELSIPEMTELFGNESTGIRAGPGNVLMFTQENIHGNFVNRTGKTRVSIDFRLAEARYGDQLARKIPGGYFEVITRGRDAYRPHHPSLANGRPNVIYLNNNTASTERVPAHLQRSMVYDYCKKHDLAYDFELFELENMSHLPTLMHLVDELACNPILYSIYSLPEDAGQREKIYARARAKGVYLFFVNEDLALADEHDQERIEQFLAFCKYGD